MCTKFIVSGKVICSWTNLKFDWESGIDHTQHRLSFKHIDILKKDHYVKVRRRRPAAQSLVSVAD